MSDKEKSAKELLLEKWEEIDGVEQKLSEIADPHRRASGHGSRRGGGLSAFGRRRGQCAGRDRGGAPHGRAGRAVFPGQHAICDFGRPAA